MKILLIITMLSLLSLFIKSTALEGNISVPALSIKEGIEVKAFEQGTDTKSTALAVTSAIAIRRAHRLFTEGMFFSDSTNFLYESGGLLGFSRLIRINRFQTIVGQRIYANNIFLAGAAKCGNFVYAATRNTNTIFRYDYPFITTLTKITAPAGFSNIRGLAQLKGVNNNRMYFSRDTNQIGVIDCTIPNALVITSVNNVFNPFSGSPLTNINALAFAKGFIWANRNGDARIYKISPVTYNVVAIYNFAFLANYEISRGFITLADYLAGLNLNGIAFDAAAGLFLITGRLWGNYYYVDMA